MFYTRLELSSANCFKYTVLKILLVAKFPRSVPEPRVYIFYLHSIFTEQNLVYNNPSNKGRKCCMSNTNILSFSKNLIKNLLPTLKMSSFKCSKWLCFFVKPPCHVRNGVFPVRPIPFRPTFLPILPSAVSPLTNFDQGSKLLGYHGEIWMTPNDKGLTFTSLMFQCDIVRQRPDRHTLELFSFH